MERNWTASIRELSFRKTGHRVLSLDSCVKFLVAAYQGGPLTCIVWVVPPPRIPVTNKGLGWDSRT